MVAELVRKGPWTEQEDEQLVFYINLFGDRRWDFVAKVSGLKRTGKSCRLRWVNYLHPDLKSGKMSPQEERLVLQLHSKWGNRWSRIARKLPGRTDNEIKNYWRTHMRKKAQEKRKTMSKPSASSSSSSLTTNTSSKGFEGFEVQTPPISETKEYAGSPVVTGGAKKSTPEEHEDWRNKVYSMDDIWKDFELSTGTVKQPLHPFYDNDFGGDAGESYFSGEIMGSPVWDDSLWAADEKENMMMFSPTIISDQLYSFCNQDSFEYI